MATYNGGKFIFHQIESILAQLSIDDELIISDDGSTDDTITIAKSFNDPRVKFFLNGRRRGPVGNFENALSKASGDIIFLADQDDKWLENKIRKHLKLHAEYDLVISDARIVNEFGEIIGNSFFEERGSKPGLINNLVKNSYHGCCMSFNRKILNQALPFPPNIHMHDWWIGLVAELKGKTHFCSDRLINYVRHQGNASPEIGKSAYSLKRRMNNRFSLIYGLFSILSKK